MQYNLLRDAVKIQPISAESTAAEEQRVCECNQLYRVYVLLYPMNVVFTFQCIFILFAFIIWYFKDYSWKVL